MQRAAEADPSYDAALESLADLVESAFGSGHVLVTQILAERANAEDQREESGCSDARLAVIRRILALHDQHDRAEEAFGAAQGLAMALSQRGDVAGAEAAYRDAEARALRLGSGSALSQARRNHGLFLAEVGRRPEAEAALRLAVADADRAGGGEMAGRARIALALFLQHGGVLAEARPLLEQGLAALDPAHPDALCGLSHLGALKSGGGCGCGDMESAMTTAFEAFVRERLPDSEFVEHLGLTMGEKGLNVEVRLRRAASEDELRELQRVIDHALHEFRRRATARS
jgi:tetratricopeptide (TPR) repeat protein